MPIRLAVALVLGVILAGRLDAQDGSAGGGVTAGRVTDAATGLLWRPRSYWTPRVAPAPMRGGRGDWRMSRRDGTRFVSGTPGTCLAT